MVCATGSCAASGYVACPSPPDRQVTVLRETPAYAGFYGAFEGTKRLLRAKLYPELPGDAASPLWVLMLSGSAGGIANWLACYPIGMSYRATRNSPSDVVKSRVQMSREPLHGLSYIPREFCAVYAADGLSGFFRGLSPTRA